MAKSKKSKTGARSKPKTGWGEPARAELHAKPVEKAIAASSETGQTSVAKQYLGNESLEATTETTSGQLDGADEQLNVYDGDVEDGTEAAQQMVDTPVSAEQDLKLASDESYELDDEEPAANGEHDSEDEDLPISSSIPRLVPASRHRAKALREGTETIRPHPSDAAKVIVTYHYKDPAGGVYTQDTVLPEVIPAPADASNEPGSLIFPDVGTSKVPRTRKGSPWTRVPGQSRYEWTRGEGDQKEMWRINIFFRRLRRDTFEFEDIYVNTKILETVDPNNKRFRTSYNKWVLQFARRRDATYTQKVVRVHWSVPERRALYAGINTFCAKFGIHRFGFTEDCKLSTRQLQLLADAVNATQNPLRLVPRGVDAVRGQIVSAHDRAAPKNKAVFELLVTADKLRARIAAGEVLPRAERKPKAAIPLEDFPVEVPVAARSVADRDSRKRKRTAAVESDTEPSSSELSEPPESEVGEDDVAERDGWMTTEEEILEGESEEGNWSDTSEEVVDGEEWEEAEAEEAGAPPAKKARTA
ncbi:hypothetical protein C7974DRAFT_471429 [Boeremia exigua]|uniref:uncharacterized protein n=1 Tax=Boeremia exigua TaxID=749465 RepID=UPI001E8DF163|nr:uncharacterized protein C7974DRAFT_471429 [Boeremia exigua]KAH6633238.1 hypothetical protein C7974DRAFT_471429 [Boeremia exigua]